MSAPLIWIVFPALISLLTLFLQKRRRLVLVIAVLVSFLLSLLAVVQPLGAVLKLGPISLELKTTFSAFGRQLILENNDRFFLAFINFAAMFWFIGSYVSAAPTKFIPLGQAILATLTAALAVEPFLYSAIFLELTAIISMPLVTVYGKPVGRGMLRYLIFQSLALPFILLAGWMLSSSQANPSDTTQLTLAALLLGLGFTFYLGVFPFHIWIPELAEETHPYVAGFLLSVLPIVSILILLNFLDGIVWLKNATFLAPVLKIVGTVMVLSGGIGAINQKDLRRLLGFAVIFETGFALLSVGLKSPIGDQTFYLSFIPRIVHLGLFSLLMALFVTDGIGTQFSQVKGQLRANPIFASALLLVMFSIAGFPLLAGFPFKVELLEQYATQPVIAIWTVIGIAAMLFATIKLLIVMIAKPDSSVQIEPSTPRLIFVITGMFILLLMGLMPNLFIGSLWNMISKLLGLA